MPAKVASHFSTSGQADGFQSRLSFLLMSIAMLGAMLLLFLALPPLLRRLPARMLNLPNRDYWLTEERKAQTVARLSHHLSVMGVIALGFMAAVGELVIRANLAGRALDNTWMVGLLALFYGGLISRVVMIYRDFRLPASAR